MIDRTGAEALGCFGEIGAGGKNTFAPYGIASKKRKTGLRGAIEEMELELGSTLVFILLKTDETHSVYLAWQIEAAPESCGCSP